MEVLFDNEKSENTKKISRYLDSMYSGMVDFYPTYIQLEHTNRCNAQCIMCNHSYIGNNGAQDVSEEVIQKIKDIFPYCQIIMLNGDGEPFLCKNIEQYLILYRQYGVRVGTNTNLCGINTSLLNNIGEYIDYLNISCDGCTKEVFEGIRKGLSFDHFIENLRILNSVAPNLRKNLDCVIMIQNILQAVDLVRFAAEYGFASIKFNMLGVNPCIGNERDSLIHYPNVAASSLKLATEEAERLGIDIVIPGIFNKAVDENRLALELDEIKKYDWSTVDRRIMVSKSRFSSASLTGDYLNQLVTLDSLTNDSICAPEICQWAIERCYIDLAGNVSTCCYNVHHYMGNILEVENFDEIWNGMTYQNFRMNMKNGVLPSWCKDCGYYWSKVKTNFAGVR